MNKCNFCANYFHFLLQFAFCGVSFGGVGACFGGYFFYTFVGKCITVDCGECITTDCGKCITIDCDKCVTIDCGESPLMNGQAMALLTNHYWPTMIDKQL